MNGFVDQHFDAFFALAIMWAALACAFAESKGRSGLAWSLAGFFGGIVGVVIAACQSPRRVGADGEDYALTERFSPQAVSA